MSPAAQYVAQSPLPKIDPSLIPEVDTRNLCRDFLAAIHRFYQDPENVKRFKAWQAQQGGML